MPLASRYSESATSPFAHDDRARREVRVLARADESRDVDAVEVAQVVDASKKLLLGGDLVAVLVGRVIRWRLDAKDPPRPGHALELVRAPIREREA